MLDGHAAPLGIFPKLVAADLRYAKILAVAVPEIEPRYGRGRKHREILGKRDFAGIPAEHLEQRGFQTVVRASRIARRWADALILLANQLLVREMLVGIAPQPGTNLCVQHLGKALGETVGERLQQDVVIIVDGLLEPLQMRLEAMDSDREAADPVFALGRDEIGKAHVCAALALLHLLAKEGQPRPVVAREHEHVVALALAAPQSDGRLRRDPALGDELVEHLLRILEQVGGAFADDRIVED